MRIEARSTKQGRTIPAFQIDDQFAREVSGRRWCLDGRGYLHSKIEGKAVSLHRYIWILHTGSCPGSELDHINRDKMDNRVSNLREVSRSENCKNKPRGWQWGRRQKKRADLPVGVKATKSTVRPYSARLKIDGRSRHLGMFATPEEASARYQQEIARLRNGEQ